MTALTPSPTITAAPPAWPAADWNALRAAGLAYVEQYAHTHWTDYNRHDPGITILELLCYAITDLSQRTSLDIKDLLRSGYASDAEMARAFPAADQVLPTTPVTLLDYRRLLLDIPGVRNAWLAPHPVRVNVTPPDAEAYYAEEDTPQAHARLHYAAPGGPATGLGFDLRGLYDITVDLDSDFVSQQVQPGGPTETEVRAGLLRQVHKVYELNRNLCEDCLSVKVLPVQRVMLCADVDLTPGADVRTVYAQLLLVADQHLMPTVQRYSLAERLTQTDANGQPLTIDQIFEGPLPANGFIREEDLAASALRDTIHASDLIGLLMAVPGVEAIREFRMSALHYVDQSGLPYQEGATDSNGTEIDPATAVDGKGDKVYKLVVNPAAASQPWELPIRTDARPQLDIDRTRLSFYQGTLPVGSNADRVQALAEFDKRKKEVTRLQVRTLGAAPLPAPVGTPRDLASYQPLALDFPANYGIGPAGLPAEAPAQRRNQARQLKAYLLFFDQLLANYLAQLQHAAGLFGSDVSRPTTYFGQVLTDSDLPGLNELYSVISPDNEAVATPADASAGAARRGRFLDHVLARFAESFADYGLLLYSQDGQRADSEVLLNKAALADDLGRFHPAQAFCYELPSWQTERPAGAGPNVAGIVRRFGRLAGLANFEPRFTTAPPPGVRLRELPAGRALRAAQAGPYGETRYYFELLDPSDETRVLGNSAPLPYAPPALALDGVRQAARTALALVRQRTAWQVVGQAGAFWYVLQDAQKQTLLRSPRAYARSAEAEVALSRALRALQTADENIYVVENLLLRPNPDGSDALPGQWLPACVAPDGSYCDPLDPYSFRVSIVLPGYTARFRNADYRLYAERLLRLELPAHILARICWVSQEQMAEFEDAYHKWLLQLHVGPVKTNIPQDFDANDFSAHDYEVGFDSVAYAQAQAALVEVLGQLRTIYPGGSLSDCGNAEAKPALVLGRSVLDGLAPPTPAPAPDPLATLTFDLVSALEAAA